MNSENDLMQRLMISKKIMDKHSQMDRNGEKPQGGTYNINTPVVEDYQPINASYNIPQEYIAENKPIPNPSTPTRDKILTSKLPDDIKKIMIENPIPIPNMGLNNNVSISDELAEKASRLMNIDKKQPIQENNTPKNVYNNNNDLRQIVKEVVTEVLRENGMITESTSKSNDNFSFRVGNHIFEGKVSKIKKIKSTR